MAISPRHISQIADESATKLQALVRGHLSRTHRRRCCCDICKPNKLNTLLTCSALSNDALLSYVALRWGDKLRQLQKSRQGWFQISHRLSCFKVFLTANWNCCPWINFTSPGSCTWNVCEKASWANMEMCQAAVQNTTWQKRLSRFSPTGILPLLSLLLGLPRSWRVDILSGKSSESRHRQACSVLLLCFVSFLCWSFLQN